MTSQFSIDILQYWAIIRRWLHLILAIAIVAALSAFVFSIRTIPVYRATSVILIQQATNNALVVDYANVLTNERLARTYAQLLTTRPVLEQTLKRLGLQGRLDPGTLKQNIRVSPVRDTSLLRIQVEDTDPERAVKLANTIPVVFSDYIETVQTQRFQESKRSLQAQIDRLQKEISALQGRLEAERQTSGNDDPNLLPLQTQLTTLQSSYANLYQQYEEVRLAEARAQDTVVLTEPALHAKRVRPQTSRNVLMALIVGLMLGAGAAFTIEYLDDTVKTPDDIARMTDLPVLSGIGEIQDEDKLPLIAAVDPKSPITEAFRILRTNIEFAGVDHPVRSLLITSPSASEGKSFITANLAVVMAQQGYQVIVVDADLRKPMQHELFGVPKNIGLTNLLLNPDTFTLEDILHETEISNLKVISCGHRPPNPAELLGSRRMQDLMSTLTEQADIVLYDTPPFLAVADASILAKHMDGILIVARVGATRLPALYQTISESQRMNFRVIGFVLNQLPPRGSGYYYYYYYSYYYHYYPDGEHSETARSWRFWPWKWHRGKAHKVKRRKRSEEHTAESLTEGG